MRTLSTLLMDVLDDSHAEGLFTLPRMKRFMFQTPYDLNFDIPQAELGLHMGRIVQLGEVVEVACEKQQHTA